MIYSITLSRPKFRTTMRGCAFVFTLLAAPLAARAAEDQGQPAGAAGLKPTTAENAKRAEKKTAKVSPPQAEGKSPAKTGGRSASEQSIVALVNDEPITGYEVQQRAVMLSGGSIGAKAQENFKALIKAPGTTEHLKAILQEVVKANPGKSKDQLMAIFEGRKKDYGMSLQKQAVESARNSAIPAMKKAALDELIDERIKLQEAKRTNSLVPDAEIDRVIDGIAEKNKMNKTQLATQLGGLEPMKQRIRSTLSFNEVVRRKFGHQIAVNGKDVDRFVASVPGAGEEQVELHIQRIQFSMPAKLDQAGVAQRIQEAEKIRAKFTDCKSTAALAKGIAGAKFEDIGKRRPASFGEPTRTLLLNAKDGEMLPPSIDEGGVELFAVCDRDVVKAEEQKRNQAEGELKQKDFELLSKRHLKDLRTDAHIEYR